MSFNEIFTLYKHIFIIDFMRYFIPASLSFIVFWVLFKKRLTHRFIQKKFPKNSKLWFEFRYSMSTILIYAMIGVGIVTAKNNGLFQMYEDINKFGWGYAGVSLLIMIFFHDFYFYWTHRWMHHPKIYKYVHKVHHMSTNPSPWTAYSFHPIEAVAQALVVPILLLTLPLHHTVVFIFLVYMIVRNVWGHTGFELFPKGFTRSKWFSWHTTTTHHSMHHEFFSCNYGLYFSWWDNWMNTTHKKYDEHYEEVTNRPKSCQIKTGIALILMMISGFGYSQSPKGKWVTYNESTGEPLSVVHIQENPEDNTYEGVIDSVIAPSYQGEQGRCMLCKGDKKGQLLIGMEFLWGFKLSGDTWIGGKIIDPESGTEYDSKIWFANEDSIYVRGYAGPFNLFYRTQIWRRKRGKGIEGIWETIDDRFNMVKSEVELKIVNGKLTGTLQRIFLLPYEGNYPICTECNGELKNKSIVGMRFMSGFAHDEGVWKGGNIVDPGSGNHYLGKIWLEDVNTLVIRGYWGPFFRTQKWKRFEATY